MRVLLFDMYSGGHHLEYASELADALVERDSSLDVEFLTLAPGEREEAYFDADVIDYLYEESPLSGPPSVLPDIGPLGSIYDYASTEVLNPRWDIVRDLVEHVEAGEYDVVHVLEIDKIHAHLFAQLRRADLPPTVGTINGVFFKPVSSPLAPIAPVRRLLRRGGTGPFVKYVPPLLYKGDDWNRWFLRRCLDTAVFDHLLVQSDEARSDIASYCGNRVVDSTTVVPDPLERWDGSDAAKRAARRDLDLPVGGDILLFFGQMREEKGIETLLSALAEYEGPPFTMVLAGPPSAVSAEEVATAAGESAAEIVSRLEFVPQSDVRSYFQAADGVVIPYHRSFGAARTSGVFQKACGTGRPVIASDFGVIGRRVRQWDLGLRCAPGDSADLERGLRTFVDGDGDVWDPESIDAYARTQSYDRLAEETYRVYRRVADGAEPSDRD